MQKATETPTTRCALLAGIAAAPVVAVPAIAPALASTDADAGLVRLGAEIDRLLADYDPIARAERETGERRHDLLASVRARVQAGEMVPDDDYEAALFEADRVSG